MRRFRTIYEITYSFMRKIRYDHVSSFAGHAALFMLMSLFPMLMFIMSMLQSLPLDWSDGMKSIMAAMPSSFMPFLQQMLDEAYTESTTIMMKSVTMVAMLYCASRGVYSVVIGINAVYGIRETRNIVLLYLISITYMLAFFAVLALTMIFIVLGNKIFGELIRFLPWLVEFRGLFGYGKYLCMFAVLFAFFTVLYMTLPNRKSKLRYEMPGAVFSTAAWLVFSWGFSFYIENYANYSITYGSLAAIIAFILWLYGTMNIVFIGGEINVVLRVFMEYGYNYRRAYEFFKDEYHGDLLKGNMLEHIGALRNKD